MATEGDMGKVMHSDHPLAQNSGGGCTVQVLCLTHGTLITMTRTMTRSLTQPLLQTKTEDTLSDLGIFVFLLDWNEYCKVLG